MKKKRLKSLIIFFTIVLAIFNFNVTSSGYIEQEEVTTKRKRLNFLIIFLTIILFIFTFNVTSSRYIGQIENKTNDVNAIPILNLNNPTFNETISNMLPGSIIESDFYVSNYDDTNINEVLMKYYIKVQIGSEIPMKVHLFDEDEAEITLDKEGKTPEETLIYGIDIQKKYHIKIEWDENNNDAKYADKDLKLNIEVVSTQVVEGE